MPGYKCASNAFVSQLLRELPENYIYVTSANKSHHLTGAAEEPAHWLPQPLARDFLDVGDFYMLCHRDDTVVRQNHPEHVPMSTTIISFYKARDTPIIYIERHGSMSLEHTIAIIEKHGFKFKATEAGTKRLGHRD